MGPDRYEMGRYISIPPRNIENQDVSTPTARSQSGSIESGLEQELSCNGRSTTDLQEPLTSAGRSLSQNELLKSRRTTPTPDSHQSSAPPQVDTGPRWATVLRSKWVMVACLLIGVASATGHHLLYSHLHDRQAESQDWWLRLGQSLSFVAKASFVIAVSMAHQQVVWRAVSQQGYSVHAIDSLFGAAHNAIELFNMEAWRKSWLAMLLAIYIWASPFVVIFTSATLRVVLHHEKSCFSVRTLNFALDAKKTWSDTKHAEGETVNGGRLSWYQDATVARDDSDSFDYWIEPSEQLNLIASTVIAGGQVLLRENVATDICGQGWDCSTVVKFTGPGYKCQQLAKGINSTIDTFDGQEAPFNLSKLLPIGESTYYTEAKIGEYAVRQINRNSSTGRPTPPFPETLGAFKTEPVIWLGYVTVDNITAVRVKNSSEDGWEYDYTPVISACEHWEIDYSVNFTYTSGLQSYNITRRDYLRKVINTTYVDNSTNDGTYDKTVAQPKENYVFPRDWKNYQRIGAYHTLGKKLRDLLHGNLNPKNYTEHSKIVESKLVRRHEYLPIPNFEAKIRHLYEDLLISLLVDPELLVVAWASEPSKMSGTGNGGQDMEYPCIRRSTDGYFLYRWKVLVTVYAVCFLVAAVGVAYGMMAMWQDGVEELREMTFSSIVEATRRVDLGAQGHKGKRIKAWLIEEGQGGRLYEFRAEDFDEHDRNETSRKNGSDSLVREVPSS
ncbi:hypothetical protein NW762_011497 [Fusarium torreyae]|uniref:Uncharacterized protein n=1 Tax=Fusarium torreyae TaxID=1237075 RepID=A0A9W8V9D6_9HYPO|nr:hypothetical protein NW762_011497 [Fusarium torreyae]